MKRDMDLCRQILMEVEKWPTTRAAKDVQIDGYTPEQAGYHSWLLSEAGLIKGIDVSGGGSPAHCFWPQCITYKGHDFLELARNDTRWTEAKDRLKSVGGGMTIQMLQGVLTRLLTAQLGI